MEIFMLYVWSGLFVTFLVQFLTWSPLPFSSLSRAIFVSILMLDLEFFVRHEQLDDRHGSRLEIQLS